MGLGKKLLPRFANCFRVSFEVCFVGVKELVSLLKQNKPFTLGNYECLFTENKRRIRFVYTVTAIAEWQKVNNEWIIRGFG